MQQPPADTADAPAGPSSDAVHRLYRVLEDKGGLTPDLILTVLVVGSWLWGTQNRNSDVDLLVVHTKPGLQGKVGTGSGTEFDYALCHLDEYLERVRAHDVSSLVTLWHPKHLVWAHPRTQHQLRPGGAAAGTFDPAVACSSVLSGSIEPARLATAACDEARRDWRKVLKKFSDGDPAMAKKKAVHAIRTLMVALQMVRNGCVADFACANDLRAELLCQYDKGWESYEGLLQPLFDGLVDDLMAAAAEAGPRVAIVAGS